MEKDFLKKYGWIYDATKDFKDGKLTQWQICQLFISRFQELEKLLTTKKGAKNGN